MEEIAISHYNNNNNVSLRQHLEILKKNGYTRSSVLKRQDAITDCPWMIEEDESEFDSAYGSEDRLSSSCGLVWPRKRSQDVSDALPPVCDEEAKNDDRLSSSCGLISSKKGAAARRSENGKKDTTRSLLRPPLQRSQSSTENYESSLTNVKRDMVQRFSSEKTQQHSSGYGSEERVRQETAVHVTMTNLLSDAENSRQVIGSLKKGLQGDNEIWHPDEMRQAILINPDLQGILENINTPDLIPQDLNPEKDFFLDYSMPEVNDELQIVAFSDTDESSFSDTDLSLHFSESEENTPRKEVEDVVDKVEKNFHGVVINTDKQMVPEVMNSLVKVAYCQAMGGRCNDAVCYLGRTYQRCMEDCSKNDNLGYCSVCKVIMAQYWMHSQDCEDEKCVVPFCMAFKERREEKGDEDFVFVYAYEVVRPSVEILQKLFELTEVQKMQANGRALWDPHYQLTDLMKGAKELTPINYVAPKLGHFGPISCHLKKQGRRGERVIVSKIPFSKDLAATLKSLHRKDPDSQRPALHNIISICLWYRQVSGDKLLVCSRYISGKTLMSHLDDPVTREECMLDAVEAASALHKLNFVYLNWKVDHMMITLNPTHLKLCNFSYAVDLSLGGTVPHHVKTGLDPRIVPPEVVEGKLCVKSDTWGLGCLLHQVLFEGLLPYPDLRHECHKDFLRKRKEPRMDVGEIFRKCWKRNMEERLSTEELSCALVQRFEYQPCQAQGLARFENQPCQAQGMAR